VALTRETIWETADHLTAAGQSPTLAAIRRALGGGSFTTISEAMTEWHAKRRQAAVPIREPVPAEIAERTREFGESIWAAALELANARLAAEREGFERQRTELAAAREEAAQAADHLSAEADALRTELQAASDVRTAADARARDAETRLEDARAAAREQEQRLRDALMEQGQLRGELTALREQSARQDETIRAFAKPTTPPKRGGS